MHNVPTWCYCTVILFSIQPLTVYVFTPEVDEEKTELGKTDEGDEG